MFLSSRPGASCWRYGGREQRGGRGPPVPCRPPHLLQEEHGGLPTQGGVVGVEPVLVEVVCPPRTRDCRPEDELGPRPLAPGGPQPHLQRRGGGRDVPRHGGVESEGGLSKNFLGQ